MWFGWTDLCSEICNRPLRMVRGFSESVSLSVIPTDTIYHILTTKKKVCSYVIWSVFILFRNVETLQRLKSWDYWWKCFYLLFYIYYKMCHCKLLSVQKHMKKVEKYCEFQNLFVLVVFGFSFNAYVLHHLLERHSLVNAHTRVSGS